jgi:PAS domain S-box-containing protein
MKELTATEAEISRIQLDNENVLKLIDSSLAVVEFEPTGVILNANQNFIDLIGYSLSEIKNRHHGMLVEPEVRLSDDYLQFWNNLANGVEQKGKFKRISKRGEPVWINGSYTPIIDKTGKVIKITKIAFDLTASIEKERRLMDEISYLKNKLITAKGIEVDRVIDQLGDKPASLQHKKLSFSEPNIDSQETGFIDKENYKLALPSLDGLIFVKIADIVYCEADSNYTVFSMIDGSKIMVSQTLKEHEQPLTQYRFFRIHHSYLININMIKQYIRGEGGKVLMMNGVTLDVAKRRKEEFLNLFSSKSPFSY